MVEKVTDKRMNITHKGLTYLPWSGHLWCRIIPTENSLGTPSLQQKRCSRPCAHPPAAALLPASAVPGSALSICLPAAPLPSVLASGVLGSGLCAHAADKRSGAAAAAGRGARSSRRCAGALTAGASQLGQCRAVLCSPQDPYSWWKC